MIGIQRQVSFLPPQPVSLAAVPIHDVDLDVPLPVAKPAAGAACARRYCSDGNDSRLPGPAPAKELEVRWAAPFTPAFEPSVVLQAGERVLAYGGGAWRLYALSGTVVAEGRSGSSPVVLDPARGLFYFVSLNGFFAAHRLADGGEEFNLNPAPGEAWPLLGRIGSRLFDLGVELPQPWRNTPPSHAILDALELPAAPALNDLKQVTNLASRTSLHLATASPVLALGGEGLTLAVAGRVYLVSADLQLRAALAAEFVPRALSVDELGRLHLVVSAGEQTALWVLTPAGQRTAAFTFKPEYGAPFGPPIVGYDHRVFLVHSGLSAHDARGRLLWEKWPRGRVAGAGITTDGQLLVSGGDLSAYDAQGERRVLFAAPGVALITAPAMSPSGLVFVASKEAVYCLGPRPAR